VRLHAELGPQPAVAVGFQVDSPAEQRAQDRARLQHRLRVAVEPRRDLLPVRFSGARQNGQNRH
jgi:hypothetical protein